jgi:predicted CoA-binding protein
MRIPFRTIVRSGYNPRQQSTPGGTRRKSPAGFRAAGPLCAVAGRGRSSTTEKDAMPIIDDIAGLRRILTQARSIAVVGLSAQWYRPSYFAAKYLQEHGYRVIPVNPTYSEVLGERCYPDLASIPGSIDVVDCFRKSEDIPPIARAAVAKGAKVLWLQLGIRNEDAARIAQDAGLDVVMDRCVKIEHARIMGGLNWAGVNTGVISARRPVVRS